MFRALWYTGTSLKENFRTSHCQLAKKSNCCHHWMEGSKTGAGFLSHSKVTFISGQSCLIKQFRILVVLNNNNRSSQNTAWDLELINKLLRSRTQITSAEGQLEHPSSVSRVGCWKGGVEVIKHFELLKFNCSAVRWSFRSRSQHTNYTGIDKSSKFMKFWANICASGDACVFLPCYAPLKERNNIKHFIQENGRRNVRRKAKSPSVLGIKSSLGSKSTSTILKTWTHS